MGSNTVSRPEEMREEVVCLGPSESHAPGAVNVDTATGWTGAGREMGVNANMLTPLPSFRLSSLLLVSFVTQIHLGARVRDPG